MIGVNFLTMNKVSVDVGDERLLKEGNGVARLKNESKWEVRFVRMISVSESENEFLSLNDENAIGMPND